MKSIEYKPTGYQSDLTEKEWEKISEYFPQANASEIHKRSLVEAVVYLVDNGCKWRALPHDYPKWSAVKSFYYQGNNFNEQKSIYGGRWRNGKQRRGE